MRAYTVYQCCHGVNVCRGNQPHTSLEQDILHLHKHTQKTHTQSCTQLNPAGQPVLVNFAALFISAQLAEGPASRATRTCTRPREPQGRETLAGPQKETRAGPYVRASSRLRSNTSTDVHINKCRRT